MKILLPLLLTASCAATRNVPSPCNIVLQPASSGIYSASLTPCGLDNATGSAPAIRLDITVAGPTSGALQSLDIGVGRHAQYNTINGSLANGSLSVTLSEPSAIAWQLPWLDQPTIVATIAIQPGERVPLSVSATISQ